VVLPFFLSRLVTVVTAQLARTLGSAYVIHWPDTGRAWINTWARWDSNWYLSIGTNGYGSTLGEQSSVAFFPLYPLLMRWLSFGSHDLRVVIAAGLIVSNVAAFLAFYFLYKLILLDDTRDVGRRAIWLLAFFPTSFFLSVVYTEGLFLVLTVAAFYAARKQRWLVAGLLGGLSAITRVIGVLLIVPLAWEWYQQKPRRWFNAVPLLLIPLALGVFMFYLDRYFGNPFVFSNAHAAWGRSTSIPALLDDFNGLISDPVPFLHGRGITTYEMSYVLLALFLLIIVFRKQRLSYALVASYAIAAPLVSFRTLSIDRLVLIIFPLFIAMGQILFWQPAFRLTLIAMAILQIILVVRWTLGYWVA